MLTGWPAPSTDMFNNLRRYDVIWVTGPQRSGTRICSHMVARDTDKPQMDEFLFGTDNVPLVRKLLARRFKTGASIHCPGLSACVHKLAGPNDFVLWLRRPAEDVYTSETRIGWIWSDYEVQKYQEHWPNEDLSGTSWEVKHRIWEEHQQRLLGPYARVVHYQELEAHPMFVGKDGRKNFVRRQWYSGQPIEGGAAR